MITGGVVSTGGDGVVSTGGCGVVSTGDGGVVDARTEWSTKVRNLTMIMLGLDNEGTIPILCFHARVPVSRLCYLKLYSCCTHTPMVYSCK